MSIGHKRWCLPDMYLKVPYLSAAPSHESISMANFGQTAAEARVTAIFGDGRQPMVIEGVKVESMRSIRLRMDQLEQYGCNIPRDTPYSVLVESSEKIVVGYGRLNWIEGHMQSFGGVGYFED